ncbi:pilus assembly PilX family protein [Halomonas sp. LS-001]
MEKIQTKKRQKGAALVIVMSLLAGGLIAGVSGMNSSILDSRLASNYNAVSKAQANAESLVSIILEDDDAYFDVNNLEDCEQITQSYSELRMGMVLLNPIVREGREGGVVACAESSANNRKFLVEGYVGSEDNPEAYHVLRLSIEQVPENNLLSNNAILAGGPVSQSGNSTVEGDFEQNVGVLGVPDPRDEHPSDSSRTGYIKSIRDRAIAEDPSVLNTCDISNVGDLRVPQTEYVYCASSFPGGDFDDEIDGLVIIAESGMSGLNIQGNVEASFVSGGTISFQGFGNNNLTGIVWAAGSVSFSGRSNIIGGVYSGGAISFSGRSYVGSNSGVSLGDGSGGKKYRWVDALN